MGASLRRSADVLWNAARAPARAPAREPAPLRTGVAGNTSSGPGRPRAGAVGVGGATTAGPNSQRGRARGPRGIADMEWWEDEGLRRDVSARATAEGMSVDDWVVDALWAAAHGPAPARAPRPSSPSADRGVRVPTAPRPRAPRSPRPTAPPAPPPGEWPELVPGDPVPDPEDWRRIVRAFLAAGMPPPAPRPTLPCPDDVNLTREWWKFLAWVPVGVWRAAAADGRFSDLPPAAWWRIEWLLVCEIAGAEPAHLFAKDVPVEYWLHRAEVASSEDVEGKFFENERLENERRFLQSMSRAPKRERKQRRRQLRKGRRGKGRRR